MGTALSLVLLASGCDLAGLVDIGDSLLDPDAALLDHPGRQLVEGEYSDLKIAGSAENGGYVLARRLDADDHRVAVVPFLEGTGCEYAPALAYDRFSSRIDIEFPGTLSVQVDEEEANPAFGTVRFIDYDCQEVIDEVPSTVLPGPLFPGVDPTGMLARSTDGTLYLIDAEKRTRTVVTPQVDYGVVAGSFLYTLEAGEVVIRDDTLDVVDRLGEGAFSIVATGGTRLPLVYEDATGIHTWTEEDGSATLADSGCYLWYVGIDSIAYYDPCDERRIAVTLPTDTVFGDPEAESFVTLRGPREAIIQSIKVPTGLPSVPPSVADMAIVTQADPALTSGTLHVLRLPNDAERDTSDIELDDEEFGDDVTFVAAHGLYYRGYDGTRGTLLDFERNEDDEITGLIEVAENVAWTPFANPYSYRGILADYDGEQGRLIRLDRRTDGSLDTEVLGEEVPLTSFVGDYEMQMVAFVSHVGSDGTGVLNVVDELGPREVADGVLADEFRLLDDPHGVVFLVPGAEDGVFELHAWLIEAELDLTIHETVSEYIPIPWPSPGVLYAVPGGRDAGLWFAKAR